MLKANYGLFWHNPGVTLGSDANPNIPEKFVTYNWNDANGDRRFQPGETVGDPTTRQVSGTISLNPDIKQPYTHEAGMSFEQQLTETIGVRAGFVYKTEDDLTGTTYPGRNALNGAYSVPFNFRDNGPDGLANTTDDATIVLYGVPSAQSGNFPVDQVVDNVPGRQSSYKTAEVSLNKRFSGRWSAQIGGGPHLEHRLPRDGGEQLSAQRQPARTRGQVVLELQGHRYLRGRVGHPHLAGAAAPGGVNFARTIAVPGTAGNAFGLIFPASTIYAEPADSRREDNIWVFDTRLDRTFELSGRVRVRGFLDFFNITNSHASETITRSTGASFLRPAAILAPFTIRIGGRLLW